MPDIAEQARETFLCLVQRPRRREDAGVFPRIGVADHHFLSVAARAQLPSVEVIAQ